MSIRDWHYGKLIILWIGAIALLFTGCSLRDDDTIGWGFAALVLTSILSWRWLSGREPSRLPPTDPPRRESQPMPDIAQMEPVAMVLYACAAQNIGTALDPIRKIVQIPKERLELEVFALMAEACHLTAFKRFERQEARLKQVISAFFSFVALHEGLQIRGDALCRFLQSRGEEYASAISVTVTPSLLARLPAGADQLRFSGNTSEDAGRLFALYCHVPGDQTVMLVGATLFAMAGSSAQTYLKDAS